MKKLAELKRREDLKRDAAWDPETRWRSINETITWAEAQTKVRRNTPARCIQEQNRKLRQP